MKTEILNIKIDPDTKKKARNIASEMGFNLSTLVNAYIKHFIKTKTVYFTANEEEPSEWLINELEQAEKDSKEGWVSPEFNNVEESIEWLNDPNRRYQNGKTDAEYGG